MASVVPGVCSGGGDRANKRGIGQPDASDLRRRKLHQRATRARIPATKEQLSRLSRREPPSGKHPLSSALGGEIGVFSGISFPHPTSKSADSSLRRAVGRSPDGNHAAPAARRGAWTRLVTHIHYPKKLRVPSDACGACLAPAARCPIMPPQRHYQQIC